METIINGINKIKNDWKNHNVVVNKVELKNGDISGTFEGKLIMEQSKKITNNELLEFFNKKFNDMDKNFDKKFDIIDKKLDLMLATPIMQKEIDHEALNKLI